MTWESFNNSILNAMGSYGATYPNYSLMSAFDFSGYANSGNFELSGLLSQNPYTADYSGNIPAGGFNFNLSACNSDTMNLVNSMYANFTQQLEIQQAQLQQMLSNFMSNTGAVPYSDEDTSYFSYDAQALKEKWSKKKPNLSDGFYNKVVEVAKRIGCDPNDLMAVMNAESGLNPSAKNKGSSASGLIQFIESTAKSLGTTTAAIRQMSAEEQLVYVEKYLKQTKAAAGIGENEKIGAGTLYSLIFLPARANRNVLTSRGETYYNQGQNYRLDTNGDGQITKDELGQRVQDFMA